MHVRLTLAALCAGICLAGATAAAALPVIENGFGMRFVELPAGSFRMGTPDIGEALMEEPDPAAADIGDEQPAHRVTFTRPLLLGRTEVTQAQWLRVMENRPGPTELWRHPDWRELPVVGVNWFMARRFAEELGRLDDRYSYRLPGEAEWEYAARAGSTGLRPFPDDELEEHGWFINNSGDRPHPVATRRANAWGLHDMLGNAWEWTADVYARDTYSAGPRTDPAGPPRGQRRVRRGGSYHCPPHMLRPARRSADLPGTRYSVLGFRVVAVPR